MTLLPCYCCVVNDHIRGPKQYHSVVKLTQIVSLCMGTTSALESRVI